MSNYQIKVGAADAQSLFLTRAWVTVRLGGVLIGRAKVTGIGAIDSRARALARGRKIIEEFEARSRNPTPSESWTPEPEPIPPWPDDERMGRRGRH